jgi:hypothetical protein
MAPGQQVTTTVPPATFKFVKLTVTSPSRLTQSPLTMWLIPTLFTRAAVLPSMVPGGMVSSSGKR